MHFVFVISNYGLGHATRMLPVIMKLIEQGEKVTIVAKGNSLLMLKNELGDASNYELMQYEVPLKFSDKGFSMFETLKAGPSFISLISSQKKWLENFSAKEKIDRVIADGEIGYHLKNKKSFFVNNQLRLLPGSLLGDGTELLTDVFSKGFEKVIVPDDENGTLGGLLTSKTRFYDKKRLAYVGILSSIRKKNVVRNVDYFISISGPGISKEVFTRQVMEQLHLLKGKVVVALGRPDLKEIASKGNAKIYPYLNRKQQESFLNKAKLVISRSGYTTMMELAEIDKKAFFIPTLNHPEQEYLAKFQKNSGRFHYSKQDSFNFKEDIDEAKQYPGFKNVPKTKKSVEKFLEAIY
ncbi:MAG: glycosyltransferase [Nanoarchaeota archaeon]